MLAACGTAPWREADASKSAEAATVSPSASPTASPSTAAPKLPNDLAKGSLKRRLSAGGVTLSVNYYSTLSMARWTAAATKPLTLAVAGEFGDGSLQDIFLTAVTVTIDVHGLDGGALTSPEPLKDQAAVTPGYLITDPSSYSQVFTLPALPVGARSLTLNLIYDVLTPSAPKSKTYLKQSASDSLVIALAAG
jgi:hypothetical protein